jgi:hypothetical protein
MIESGATVYKGLAIQGGYAYVACGPDGLEVFDISNPAAPVLVGSYKASGYAWAVTVAGSYAYVANGNSVLVVNVSNPGSPTLAGSVSTAAKDVVVAGSYAYVAGGNVMQVVDVSNPSAPVLRGALHVSNSYSIVRVRAQNATVYAAASAGGLITIDVSDPTNPVQRGQLTSSGVSGSSTIGLAVSGTQAYLADYVAGLGVVDISSVSSPSLTGSCMEWFTGAKMASSGNTLVVTGTRQWDGGLQNISAFRILNMQTPATPVLMGSMETNAFVFNGTAIGGSYMYVACGTAGMRVIDISNPSAPSIVGSYDTPGYAWGVALAGQYAYVADGNSVQVLNVSNPASPAYAGSVTTSAKDIAVAGSRAYVAGLNVLQIVDISNPSAPAITGTLSFSYPISAVAVKVQNGIAYVAGSAGGLLVVDVSNPTNPTQLGSLSPSGGSSASTLGVFVSGTHAYVGNYVGGFAIVDVSNPASPALRNLIMTMGSARDVVVSSGWAWTTDSSATVNTIYLGQ